ncbi:MAG: hypothetical protein IIT69_03360, partial [Bacteroidales bacterium]|nr:hypothetical protein [Bacteroidales bacterium]
ILRMLQAAYDYVFDREGHMLLIHPGLADPDRMITQMDFFKPDEPLLPAGLIGPVEILGFEN